MYDYRKSIQQILDHTGKEQHELISSAYAINTICDIILKSQSKILKLTEPAQKDVNKSQINSTTTSNDHEKRHVIYSKTLIGKLHAIFAANPDLNINSLSNALGVSYSVTKRIVDANDAILINKHASPKRSFASRDQLLSHLTGITSQEMLDDHYVLNVGQAKHAFDNFRKTKAISKSAITPKKPGQLALRPTYDSFGEMMKDVRNQLQESQSDFGKRFNISFSQISQIENDHIAPQISFVETLANLVGVSLAELKKHVKAAPQPKAEKQLSKVITKIETKDNPFRVTSQISNKEIAAYCLIKPLKRNTFLAKRNFNQVSLLNNKGDIMYMNNDNTNKKLADIETGDLVTANIINRHQAYILNVEHRHLNIEPYVTIKNAHLIKWYDHWITYGNHKETLQNLNEHFNFYSVPKGFASTNHLKATTTIDITWRKFEPDKIVITGVHEPTASSRH